MAVTKGAGYEVDFVNENCRTRHLLIIAGLTARLKGVEMVISQEDFGH